MTFLAENFRPSLDLIRQYDRKSLEDNPIPQLAVPSRGRHAAHSRSLHRRRVPKTRAACARSTVCQPTSAEQEEPCAKQILTTLLRRAYRRPATRRTWNGCWGSTRKAAAKEPSRTASNSRLRRILTSPQFLVRAEREPENVKPASRIASPISNSRRGSRSFCGAAFPTTR